MYIGSSRSTTAANVVFFLSLVTDCTTQGVSVGTLQNTESNIIPNLLIGTSAGGIGTGVIPNLLTGPSAASTGQPGGPGGFYPTTSNGQPAPSVSPASIVPSSQVGTQSPVPSVSQTSPTIVAPVTTTFIAPSATTSVFAVSSQVAGLVPVINSWKINPISLKSDTLNKIKPVRDHVESLISSLGGHSSSPCGEKKKRSLLNKLNVLNTLSCIDDGLGKITDHINGGEVDDIDDSLNDLTSENTDLTDPDDDDDSSSDSESQSSTDTSSPLSSTDPPSSSASSCATSATALQVTVQCMPTSMSAGGSFIPTSTCSPVTTLTTTGCSVIGFTTTTATGTSTSLAQIPCASDTCGDACPMNKSPLSGDGMGIVSPTSNCASISTVTTSSLPTAGYGVFTTAIIATPTPESSITGPSERNIILGSRGDGKTLVDHSLARRVLPTVTPPYAPYIQWLSRFVNWIGQDAPSTGYWYNFPAQGHLVQGVNGIYGCTSVIIVSEKGVYLSHIWEGGVFNVAGTEYVPTDDNTFITQGFNALRDGTANAQSITALIGSDQNPGPLNTIYSPKVFVLTPYTTFFDRTMFGITTTLRYEQRAQWLAQQISQLLPGSENGGTLGYTRTNPQESTQPAGTAGRAIFEVDPFQYILVSSLDNPEAPGLQIGAWRLWVEDQLILYQTFWRPNTTPPGGIQGRDFNVCGSSTLSGTNTRTGTSILVDTSTLSGTSTFPASITSPPVSSTLTTVPATSWDPVDCMPVENPRYYLSAMVCSCNNGHTYSTMASAGILGPCGFTTPPESPLSTMPIVTPSPTPEDPSISNNVPSATITGLPSTTASKWPVPSDDTMEVCAGTNKDGASDIFTCYDNSTLFRIFAPAGTPHSNSEADNDEDGFATWMGGGCVCQGGNFCCLEGSRVPIYWDDGAMNRVDTDITDPAQAALAFNYFLMQMKSDGGGCGCDGNPSSRYKRYLDVIQKDNRRSIISSARLGDDD